ncbi:cytochrome c biogenesis CcdA family protein [Demequina sp. B12]|uniref:cytochrome c biogenesis CcdA family protein n=1 Tax=Demequina sp. B12 TaxID=2992757 RepID=UPI00237C35B4|nr:cytochrome c biogenesis CcdA family protein [Demequina sp. B12]MDE0572160.1 cytochrome c biogenesis CcdA family protein [Demequina sp. B12]
MLDTAAAAYALVLGAVAAFNPCGFALLPAYITALVTGSADSSVPRTTALRRAIRFGVAMSAGFLAVFLLLGLLFGGVNLALQASILPYVSYVTIVIGVALAALGVVLTVRGEMSGPGLRLDGRAPRTTFWSQVGYGAAFAIASLSCTIGLFLVVVTQALNATNPANAVVPFLAYALGMGTAVVLVSILAALLGSGLAAGLRRHTVAIMRAGGVLMVLAGVYVAVFGLAEVLPRYGVHALEPVLEVTISAQQAVSAAVSSWGTPVLIALGAVALAAVVWAFVTGRADARETPAPASTIRVADASTLDSIKDKL